MTQTCPVCRQTLTDEARACPFCGTDLSESGAAAAPPPTAGFPPPGSQPVGGVASPNPGQTGPYAQPPGAGFPPASQPGGGDPFTQPPGMIPVVPKIVKRAVIALVVLAAIGGLVVGFLAVTKNVTHHFEGVLARPSPNAAVNIGGGKGGSGKGASGGTDSGEDMSGAREVFREMNANGAPCDRYSEVVDTDIVSAAVCYSGLEVWTIQVFFDDLSYNAVVANYKSSDTIHVAYGGNWTVLTQNKSSARKIAAALGGHGK